MAANTIPGLNALRLPVPEPGDAAKIQAMIGSAQAQNTKVYKGHAAEELKLDESHFDAKATLVFANCKDTKIHLNSHCTKVFMSDCENVTFFANSRIITKVVELYKCHDCRVETGKEEIGTLQLDMCGPIHVHYTSKEHLNTIIWAGVDQLDLTFGDHDTTFKTTYEEVAAKNKELVKERGQFIVRWVGDQVLQEAIVRLDNGFPTTFREKTEFEERQEENLAKLAKEMGISIKPKRSADKKIPPNKPCPKCDSGKKYKKCCGAS